MIDFVCAMDDDVQVLDAPPSRGVAARNAIVIPESTSEVGKSLVLTLV